MSNIDIFKARGLTDSEAKVADFASKGLRSKEIAFHCKTTEKTVKFHLTNIYKKLQVNRHILIQQYGYKASTDDEVAISLLLDVVTRGRNGMPYQERLGELKVALEKSPGIKRVIGEAFDGK